MLADLRARHVTAAKDLPERRLHLREADLKIAGTPKPARPQGGGGAGSACAQRRCCRRPARPDRDAVGRRGRGDSGGGASYRRRSVASMRPRPNSTRLAIDRTLGNGARPGYRRSRRPSQRFAPTIIPPAAALPLGLARRICRPFRIGSASCGPGRGTSRRSSQWRSHSLKLWSAGKSRLPRRRSGSIPKRARSSV